MQRMPDDLHKRVKKVAKEKGMTITGMINMLLTDYVDGESEIEAIKKRLDVLEKEVFEKKKK